MGDEDHRGVDRLELALQPFEVADVEVVRRLVEEQQVGPAGKSARERRARQLSAGERAQRAVELVLREPEATHGRRGAVAPGPTAGVLEARLRFGVAPERRVVVRALRHRLLERSQVGLHLEQIPRAA